MGSSIKLQRFERSIVVKSYFLDHHKRKTGTSMPFLLLRCRWEVAYRLVTNEHRVSTNTVTFQAIAGLSRTAVYASHFWDGSFFVWRNGRVQKNLMTTRTSFLDSCHLMFQPITNIFNRYHFTRQSCAHRAYD